jgi:hypothetical protein
VAAYGAGRPNDGRAPRPQHRPVRDVIAIAAVVGNVDFGACGGRIVQGLEDLQDLETGTAVVPGPVSGEKDSIIVGRTVTTKPRGSRRAAVRGEYGHA